MISNGGLPSSSGIALSLAYALNSGPPSVAPSHGIPIVVNVTQAVN